MKLIFAVMDSADAEVVSRALTVHGYSSTRLTSTATVRQSSNETLMIGIQDKATQAVIDIIAEYSHTRENPEPQPETAAPLTIGAPPRRAGGAMVFVVDVTRSERV